MASECDQVDHKSLSIAPSLLRDRSIGRMRCLSNRSDLKTGFKVPKSKWVLKPDQYRLISQMQRKPMSIL